MGESIPPGAAHTAREAMSRDAQRASALLDLIRRVWPPAAQGRDRAGLPRVVADLLRPAPRGGLLRHAVAELDHALPGWVEVAAEMIAAAPPVTPDMQCLCALLAQRPLQQPEPLIYLLSALPIDPGPRLWLLVALAGTDTAAVRTAWKRELRRCCSLAQLSGTPAAWFAFSWALLRGWLTWPEFRDGLTAGRALAPVHPRGEYRRPLERLGLWSHPTFAKWYRQAVYEAAAQPDVALSFGASGWIRDFPGQDYLLDALTRLQEQADAWWPLYVLRWASDLAPDDPALVQELRHFSPTALCLLALLRPDLAGAVEAATECRDYAAVLRWLCEATPATPFDPDWCRLVFAPWVAEYHEVITVATGALCSLTPPPDYAPRDMGTSGRRAFLLEHLDLDLELLMDNFLFVLALSEEHAPLVLEEARRGRTSAIRALSLRPELAEQTIPLLFSLVRRGRRSARAAAQETLLRLAEQSGITDLRLLEQRVDLASAWADSSASGTPGRVWWNVAGYHLRLAIERGEVRLLIYSGDRPLRALPTEVRRDPGFREVRTARDELGRRYRYLRRRLEQAMEEGLTYRGSDLAVLLSSPAARSLVSRLVLHVDGQEFRWAPADPLLEVEVPPELAAAPRVTVAHPVELHQSGTLGVWQERATTEMAQPFKQVFREIYVVGERERASLSCERFSGCSIKARQAFALLRRRGYAPRQGDAVKDWPLAHLRAHLRWADPREPVGKLIAQREAEAPVTFGEVWFEGAEGEHLLLGEVPPVILSETLRDADLTVSLAAFGEAGFTSEETRRLRALLIRHLTRAMRLTTIYVSEDHSHVLIDGLRALYRLHLGSGSVLLEHSRRHLDLTGLAEEPVDNALVEGMDSTTTQIIRTVMTLSRDDRITDPHFLSQLE